MGKVRTDTITARPLALRSYQLTFKLFFFSLFICHAKKTSSSLLQTSVSEKMLCATEWKLGELDFKLNRIYFWCSRRKKTTQHVYRIKNRRNKFAQLMSVISWYCMGETLKPRRLLSDYSKSHARLSRDNSCKVFFSVSVVFFFTFPAFRFAASKSSQIIISSLSKKKLN